MKQTSGERFFEQHKAQLLDLCKRYPVDRLYLFGSILTDRFDPEKSDVDMQVLFESMEDPATIGAIMWKFWDELEAVLGRKVDLLTKPEIRNPFFRQEVEHTRQLIYEHQSEEIPV